jgi:hypothetical protein
MVSRRRGFISVIRLKANGSITICEMQQIIAHSTKKERSDMTDNKAPSGTAPSPEQDQNPGATPDNPKSADVPAEAAPEKKG